MDSLFFFFCFPMMNQQLVSLACDYSFMRIHLENNQKLIESLCFVALFPEWKRTQKIQCVLRKTDEFLLKRLTRVNKRTAAHFFSFLLNNNIVRHRFFMWSCTLYEKNHTARKIKSNKVFELQKSCACKKNKVHQRESNKQFVYP